MVWTPQAIEDRLRRMAEDHLKDIGRKVATLRKARGWSQEDLAREAKTSTQTISRFERGAHEGRRSTTRAIAAALGVEESDLVGEFPDPFAKDDTTERLERIEAKLDLLLNHAGLSEAGTGERPLRVPPGPPAKPEAPQPKRTAQGPRST